MVENKRVSSLPLNSDNEFSEHTPLRSTTLSGGSSIVGGEGRGYTTSHTTLTQTPPAQLSSGRGYPISPLELNEDVRKNSSKRLRERPPRSKTNPKSPIVIREDEDDAILRPTLIEIPRGNDIVETLINLARHHNANITVLSGSGLVSEITLHNPMSPSPTLPIKGAFNMMSIFGTYINANCGHVNPRFITNPACSSFSIYISCVQGQVFGGIVGGKVISAAPVIVTATLFKKSKFHSGAFVNRNIDTVVSAFGVAGSNSTSLNRQLPPPSPANVNHSTFADSY